ncbi:hypothetical protein JCM9279_003302 [Rhodotorula babjevae]
MLGHKCGICLSSRSEHLPPTKHAHEDWCALTSCGHVYHLSCIEQWHRIGNEHGCPARCTSRNVKRQKRAGSHILESLPYLRLYVDAPRAPGANVPPSSDAVDAPEVEVEVAPRVQARRDKGKARAVPDDEDDDDDGDGDESEQDDGGAVDEVTRLRRQRTEALDTVRRQRDELAQLRERLRFAEMPRPPPRTARPGMVSAWDRAEPYDGGPIFAPPGPHPSDVHEAGVHDPAEAYDVLYHDPFAESDDDGGDEYDDCEECGHAHAEDESCIYQRGSLELRDAEREIAQLRRDARRNDPQAVAALAAQLRAHKARYDELEMRHRELDARVDDLVRQRNEAQSVYHEAKIKWQEEVRRLKQQLNASGESGEEVIRQLGQEIEAKEREILHLKAAQEGREQRADEACKKAADAAQRARNESLAAQAEAKRSVEAAMDHAAQEVRLRKRVDLANKAALEKIKKLKAKNKDRQTKRGVLAPDSDDDDDDDNDNAFLPLNASITLSHTRSRASLTPDDPSSAFRINNKSRLLASPAKRSAHSRTPFDEAGDVSLETDPVEDADADAEAHPEDDELEYADVDMAQDDDDEVENRPPQVDLDSDSDIEIVEPVPSKYFSSSAPVARPLGARNSAPAAAVDLFSPPRSGSGSASTSGKKRAFGLTTLAEGSSSSSAASSSWASKKPALSQSRADKYLPDFASAAAVRKAAAAGPKRKVKRR